MRAHWLQLSFVVLLGCALTAGGGCGDDHQRAGTGGQSGGGSGGSAGMAGGGGGGGGAGGSGASACATNTASSAAGTGGGVEQLPQQIHDALLNAPTTGGIDVTRTPPTATYPTCQ
jgi:hypothetical protein